MSLPPIVQWWNEEETAQQSQWDAGAALITGLGDEGVVSRIEIINNPRRWVPNLHAPDIFTYEDRRLPRQR